MLSTSFLYESGCPCLNRISVLSIYGIGRYPIPATSRITRHSDDKIYSDKISRTDEKVDCALIRSTQRDMQKKSITRSHDLVTRANELLTRGYELYTFFRMSLRGLRTRILLALSAGIRSRTSGRYLAQSTNSAFNTLILDQYYSNIVLVTGSTAMLCPRTEGMAMLSWLVYSHLNTNRVHMNNAVPNCQIATCRHCNKSFLSFFKSERTSNAA